MKGRSSEHSPKNRFLQHEYVETEELHNGEKEAVKTQVFKEKAKSLVNEIKSPDLNLQFSINAYQGCEHGCAYCYARPSHEYWGFDAGLDFESKIVVKENAPRLLAEKLNSRSWEPAPIAMSGNTDCYQPLEKQYRLSRKLLGTFLQFGNPVSVITKNALIERDLDVLAELAEENLVHVYFSITSLNERVRRKLEPRTSTAKRKLAAIEKLSTKGIPVGIMNAPIIPGLNDQEIPQILRLASESGALSAGYTTVRLNGSVAEVFTKWLQSAFPDRYEKITHQIKELHGGKLNDSQWGRRMRGDGKWADLIRDLFHLNKQKYFSDKGLPDYDLSRFRPSGVRNLF